MSALDVMGKHVGAVRKFHTVSLQILHKHSPLAFFVKCYNTQELFFVFNDADAEGATIEESSSCPLS